MKPLISAVLLCAVLVAATASAEPLARPAASQTGLAASIARVTFEAAAPGSFAPSQLARLNRPSPRVGAAIAFGFLGMLGGAWLGYSVDDCACDSPGLRGASIGMPIGAVVGAVVGYRLAR